MLCPWSESWRGPIPGIGPVTATAVVAAIAAEQHIKRGEEKDRNAQTLREWLTLPNSEQLAYQSREPIKVRAEVGRR